MKIGVIGGTFDPIHVGHLSIAYAAFMEYELDRLWLMPAGDPYFKEESRVSPPEVRLCMTRLAAEDFAAENECAGKITVSDFEISDKEKTYSAETFARLNLLYPEDSFYFIVGYDSLKSMRTWYKPGLLFANAVILCAPRDEGENAWSEVIGTAESLKSEFAQSIPDIRLIHTPLYDISSTQIRHMVKNGEDISPLVTKSVKEYIDVHGLYR